MPKQTGTEGLPPGWWQDEDGATAFIALLDDVLKNGTLADLGALVEESEPLGQVGADDATRAIAIVACVRWLRNVGPGIAERPTPDEPHAFEDTAELLAESFTPDDLSVPLSGHIADIYRRAGNLETAAEWYRRAAAGAQELEMQLRRGIYLQSLGSALSQLGDNDTARATSEIAAQIFDELNEVLRYVAVELNLVQIDLTNEAFDQATIRLVDAKEHAAEANDSHYNSSIQRLEAMLLIEGGEYEAAREQLLRIYRSRIRAGDLPLAQVVAQNVAKLTQDTKSARGSIHWWRSALELAERTRETEQELLSRLGLAKALLDARESAEAIRHLETLVNLYQQIGREAEALRIRADLGAAYLFLGEQRAEQFRQGHYKTKQPVRDQYRKAESHLLEAFRGLEQLKDEEWIGIVAHNLRIAWYVLEFEAKGIEILEAAADRILAWSPRLTARVIRVLGSLQNDSEQTDIMEAAASRFIQAASIEIEAGINDPFRILEDAQSLAAHLVDYSFLAELFDLAQRSAEPLGSATVGDILNDFALIYASQDQFDQASELLERARQLAEQSSNRVLAARVELNLGEIAFRQEQFELATAHLSKAATLSIAVGDLEQASLAYSSCANSYLSLDSGRDQAFASMREAETLARQANSPDAMSRAASARASLAFEAGDYQDAFEYWNQAALGISPSERATYRAFALDALAEIGEWRLFSARLISYARESQREHTQLKFAADLWHSAMTWLRQGRERRAAKVLAYSALLAVERVSQIHRSNRFDDSHVPLEQMLVELVRATTPVRALIELEERPEASRDALSRWFEWYVRRAIDDEKDAKAILSIVLKPTYLGDPAE